MGILLQIGKKPWKGEQRCNTAENAFQVFQHYIGNDFPSNHDFCVREDELEFAGSNMKLMKIFIKLQFCNDTKYFK